ncbi:MAG: hypothetical protein M1546_08070 [Chloroflexi bacterium]|nr:hypothetical protein [Chloroflexota bacterium]
MHWLNSHFAVGGWSPLQRQPSDDLFLYVTDGTGSATHDGTRHALGQYDVMLVRADADRVLLVT